MTMFFGITALLFSLQGQLWLASLFLLIFLWLVAEELTDGPSSSRRDGPPYISDRQSFGDAFALARKKGLDQFEWRGGVYHTRTAEEEAAKAAIDPTQKSPARGGAECRTLVRITGG